MREHERMVEWQLGARVHDASAVEKQAAADCDLLVRQRLEDGHVTEPEVEAAHSAQPGGVDDR